MEYNVNWNFGLHKQYIGRDRCMVALGGGKIKQFKDNSYSLSLNEDFIIDTLNEVRLQR